MNVSVPRIVGGAILVADGHIAFAPLERSLLIGIRALFHHARSLRGRSFAFEWLELRNVRHFGRVLGPFDDRVDGGEVDVGVRRHGVQKPGRNLMAVINKTNVWSC